MACSVGAHMSVPAKSACVSTSILYLLPISPESGSLWIADKVGVESGRFSGLVKPPACKPVGAIGAWL